MADMNIFREPTFLERQDFKVIGENDWKKMCDKHLKEMQQEFTSLHEPFDYACARIDVYDRVKAVITEAARSNKKEQQKILKDLGVDWDEVKKKYSDPSRFEKIGKEIEDKQPNPIDRKTMETVSFTQHYACKLRGHKFAISTSVYELYTEEGQIKIKSNKKI